MDSQLKHTASPTKVSFMSHTKVRPQPHGILPPPPALIPSCQRDLEFPLLHLLAPRGTKGEQRILRRQRADQTFGAQHEIATPQSSPIKSAKKPSIELDRESRHALEGFMLASQMY
mmetsp:Transcript_69562/g.220238  ORF Transcript_69562/g.220238 Transcript_69562/m.220238 type:complete len:116 (+) Transcript_69562:79-426(+)